MAQKLIWRAGRSLLILVAFAVCSVMSDVGHAQDVFVAPNMPKSVRATAASAAAQVAPEDVLSAAAKLPAVVTEPLSLDPASPPPALPPLDLRSRQCAAHTDCVLVTDNCGVQSGAVNKAYVENWKAANFNITPNCRPLLGPGELAARTTAVCLNNVCGTIVHAPGKGPTELPPVNPAVR